MGWFLALLACSQAGTSGGESVDSADGPVVRLADGDDTRAEPAATVDLVIVGAGASGLGAAAMAWQGGLDLVVVEARSDAGGSGAWAKRMWGAGTETQAEHGVSDSPELALLEWDAFTSGDATDPRVQNFVHASADVLGWLQGFGWSFAGIARDAETGSVPRVHEGGMPGRVVSEIVAWLGDDLWLDTRMTGLVMDGGAVAGIRIERTTDGSTGWIRAERTLLATGGFARDDDRVVAAVPELAELGWVHEALPIFDGNGLDVLEAAGIPLQGRTSLGVYGHAVADPRFDPPRALTGVWMAAGIVVDASAERVIDESLLESFGGGRALAEHGRLWAVVDSAQCDGQAFTVTPFDYDVASSSQLPERTLTVEAFEDIAVVSRGESIEALAEEAGLDGPALAETVERYNSFVRAGEDRDFGRPMVDVAELFVPPYRAFRIEAGPAKSYGGAALSTTGQVLDARGEPVPGLYAAGELAGMLGTEAIGWGFAGSITAAWYGGLMAGEAVVADLAAERGAAGPRPRRWRPVADQSRPVVAGRR